MEKYDDFADVDSNDVHSTHGDTADVELYDDDDDEDESYSTGGESLNYQSSDDSDDADKDDADADDDPVEVDAVLGDTLVRINSITSDEIRALEFGTIDAAYEFYYQYGKCKGFAIRKSDSRKRGPKGNRITVMRQFVCSKHGLRDKKHLYRIDRKREHRRLTRTNCPARLRVHYKAEKDRYVVSMFVEGHNHELNPSSLVHLHPVYRKTSEADRAQIDGIQSHGIRTCHIMGYMVAQKGGYAGVGLKKDLYNYFDKKMREIVKDGDVEASLNYLNVKSSTDPMLYAEYAVNIGDGRMKCLFWADGSSRSDYFCFGDVVAFDTTYKKKKYNYPLIIFSGFNHHSQTIIFGAALVADETTETYKWVLRCFLECMGNKHPKSVVTDGDGDMREAIKQVFPDATYRLCAWHLSKNATENVKNSEFLEGFRKAIYSNFTNDQFEEFWAELIKENELEGNPWVAKTYENKSLWATAYLRDKFFGRLRTKSQCEAINAIINCYVRNKWCIFEFMHNFEQAVTDYRNNEVVADFKSKYTEPVLTTHLRLMESDAAKIYTAEIFKEVKDEIMKVGALIVKDKYEHGKTKTYTLTKYCKDNYEREVVYDGDTLQCSCKLFDSCGLPCSHIFYVMKEEHVDHIPRSLVLSRWTKDAKIKYLNSMDCNGTIESNLIELARFGAYCSAFTHFCKEASKKNGVCREIMEDIMNLQKKYCSTADPVVTQKSAVGDPKTAKSKGASKKNKNDTKVVRHHSKCKSTTHNARNCSVTENMQDKGNVESEPVSIGDSLSQIEKNKKRKTSCHGETSAQNNCSDPPQNRGVNVTTTSYVDITSRAIPPMYGIQHVMPAMHPVGQSMQLQVQPMYPIYGMPVGENSNSGFGQLQQVMKSAGRHE
ncbi:unnamed protein product [Trifolium pratense]|uniref:Uncharacterized protein n=1 Tax=Trifolium pratense TaxID=57577 RepID=A0ACB0IXR8_TRIPR|nr:unnamed protein product [Trifolium pratense]